MAKGDSLASSDLEMASARCTVASSNDQKRMGYLVEWSQ